jgi:hypothetical protein
VAREIEGIAVQDDRPTSGGNSVRSSYSGPVPASASAIRPPFLSIRVRIDDQLPSLLGLCAGYQDQEWRADGFARYLIEHLVEFVYPPHEWSKARSDTAIEMATRAAKAVYSTEKHERRGEVGELLLFAILRAYYGSIPIISKLYFKSAANDTVKGFDAVHFVEAASGLELWLGEAKLYTDAGAAIRDVVAEIEQHTGAEYLRQEFAWIGNKLPSENSHYETITALLDDRTSLDEVFKVLHVPVLITYDSSAIGAHKAVTQEFEAAITNEMSRHHSVFCQRFSGMIRVHVILVPLGTKKLLLDSFDAKLKALQTL